MPTWYNRKDDERRRRAGRTDRGKKNFVIARGARFSPRNPGVLDVSVAASADDGYSYQPGDVFNNSGPTSAVGTDPTLVYDTFLRFLNVTVPQGATITLAYLEVVLGFNRTPTNLLSNVYGNATDSAVAPTTQATHAAKVRTTAFTAWDGGAAWSAGTARQSPDISAVIQEIIDRPGWASGNALQILWDDDGSANLYLPFAALEHATYAAPLLHIEWTA